MSEPDPPKHEDAVEAQPPEDTGTAVIQKVKPAPPKVKRLPPFKVLLHNDDVNDMDHVVTSILKATTLPLEDAVKKTLEAHDTGVALLLVTHRERAELYCEQFATFQLTVTMEPDA